MPHNLEPFASALGIVFLAELGDKSMLFSLAAATRYRWWVILLPMAAATALLMALAVAVGGAAGEVLPERVVAVVAAALFIGFGLWTLRTDDDGDDEEISDNGRSIPRVMLAFGTIFFLAEFGDKTQIAALSLAGLHSGSAALVWLGASLGMAGANGTAIFAGNRLQRVLSPRIVRIAAGIVFIVFGLAALVFAFV